MDTINRKIIFKGKDNEKRKKGAVKNKNNKNKNKLFFMVS